MSAQRESARPPRGGARPRPRTCSIYERGMKSLMCSFRAISLTRSRSLECTWKGCAAGWRAAVFSEPGAPGEGLDGRMRACARRAPDPELALAFNSL